MTNVGYTTRRTLDRVNNFLDNMVYLLEQLNDSRGTVFLMLRTKYLGSSLALAMRTYAIFQELRDPIMSLRRARML